MVEKEIRLFEHEGIRGVPLQPIYDYLSTTVPSGIECERAFHAADLICTKTRPYVRNQSVPRCKHFFNPLKTTADRFI